MKKYELILQGDKRIILDDLDAKKLLKAIEDEIDLIEVQGTKFKRSMFKGLFPIKEEISDNKEAWIAANKSWHDTCLKMSKYPLEKKLTTELENRILPGLKLGNITIPPQLLEPMKANISMFFEANPLYPRCPMKIWWPFLRAKIAPLDKETKRRANPSLAMAKWWEFVGRNDNAIAEWVSYQEARL